jgi:hypothetical protein
MRGGCAVRVWRVTIEYPDVSNYQRGMALQPGTVAVCAKASEGSTFADGYYAHYRSEAARVGAVFFAYHFLHPGGGAAQAAWCHSVTGSGVNAMIDLEPTGGAMPSVADAVDFAVRYRALGGLCSLAYLPRWAWQQLGSPSLAPLARAGLSLVSSDYTAYADSGPGWAGYGGLNPVVWQYTDRQAYSGTTVDFNAFRGTLDQLRALLGYAPGTDGDDMPITESDAAVLENRKLGTIASPPAAVPAQTSLGVETASNPARWAALNAKVDALAAAVAQLGAPTPAPAASASASPSAAQNGVDVSGLASSLAALVHPAVVEAARSGQVPGPERLARVFEQHLADALS